MAPVSSRLEADSFWCLTKLLDGIQDNYIFAQPGITRQVASLRDLVQRIDQALVNHLNEVGVEFIQFSFRWMNCMLMREFSVKNVLTDMVSDIILKVAGILTVKGGTGTPFETALLSRPWLILGRCDRGISRTGNQRTELHWHGYNL